MDVRIQQGLEILADILCDELSDTGGRMLTGAPDVPGMHRGRRRIQPCSAAKGSAATPARMEALAGAQEAGR